MLFRFYRYCNLLSLDVALGACICSIYLSFFLQIDIPWLATVVLGLTVWVIYTFDHLQDASRIKGIANTDRHRFHQVYFKPLVIVMSCVMLNIGVLVFNLPIPTILWGVALACVVVSYFMILYFLGLKAAYHKEILIAIIYACGVFLPSFSVYNGFFTNTHILIFLIFVNMALINLITFSWLESKKDRFNGFPSLVNVIGERQSKRIIILLLIAQIVMIMGLMSVTMGTALIFLLMTLVLGGIMFFYKYFSQYERYRIVGDLVFLLPVIGLL